MYSFNLLYKKHQEICMYDTIVFCSWNYVLCLSTKAKPTLSIPHFLPFPLTPHHYHHQSKFDANEPMSFFLYFKMHFCEIKQKKEENILKKGILNSIGLPYISIELSALYTKGAIADMT